MTHAHPPRISSSRLVRCSCGTYHLTVGNVTLNLPEDDLLLIARTVLKMAARHPDLHAKLVAGVYADGLIDDDPAGTDDHAAS